MKRKLLFLLIPVGIIFLVYFVMNISLSCPSNFSPVIGTESNWMECIPDETLLKEIAIPGSHDAGTYGMPWPGETQNVSFSEQLSYGARYFDIRVNKTGSRYQIFHSVFNGIDFSYALSEIKEFIMNNPSEVLLLDFQHFKGESQADVASILSRELLTSDLILKNDTTLSDMDFIRTLSIGDARGKCIIFFGDNYNSDCNWIFLRNDDLCTQSSTVLDSYYIGSLHKAGFNSLVFDAHPVYFEHMMENKLAELDAFFVLQCQQTDGKFIIGPWYLENHQEEKMNTYIKDLKDSQYLNQINIILRDFLTPEKCRDIIDLNIAKGTLPQQEGK